MLTNPGPSSANNNIMINVRNFTVCLCRYSDEERAQIGKYASIYGAASAARHFSRKLDSIISESQLKLIISRAEVMVIVKTSSCFQ